ncbi:Phosphatidate cytidylyltransferase photoreceptor-specific [Taenia solium]|eukprot:TsM_000113100 transcript=TsM_000113100 gene=TsM_000113100
MGEGSPEVTRRRHSPHDEANAEATATNTAAVSSAPPRAGDYSSADEAIETPLASDLDIEPNAAEKVPHGSDHVPVFLETSVAGLSPRLTNCIVRLFMSIVMIGGFLFLIYLGPLALVLLVLCLQLACFKELIHIGHVVYRTHNLPWFRTLSWMFLFTSNYFFFGESLIGRFRILLAKEDFLAPLVVHHRFISFTLYCGCIVAFVLSLVRRHYLKQFTLFGWTHVSLLIIVSSSHFMIQSIFDGLIWFLVPVAMVISNDIFAYVFGMLFGKTPLIKVSPKKTWEGFIGGGISSLLLGLLVAWSMIDKKHFICPIEYDDRMGALSMDCVPDAIFIPRMYNVSRWLFFVPVKQVAWYPYFFHCALIGAFVSIIGPFGGFFASGFKRAFKIKDFGDVIPGHGGILDRFDCQIFVGWFIFFYYNSFVKPLTPGSLLQQVFVLPRHEQLAVLNLFLDGLLRRGHVPRELAEPLIAYGEEVRAVEAP